MTSVLIRKAEGDLNQTNRGRVKTGRDWSYTAPPWSHETLEEARKD